MNNLKIRDTLDQTYLRSYVFGFFGNNIYWQVAICVREPLETTMDRTIIGLMREHLDIKSENEQS